MSTAWVALVVLAAFAAWRGRRLVRWIAGLVGAIGLLLLAGVPAPGGGPRSALPPPPKPVAAAGGFSDLGARVAPLAQALDEVQVSAAVLVRAEYGWAKRGDAADIDRMARSATDLRLSTHAALSIIRYDLPPRARRELGTLTAAIHDMRSASRELLAASATPTGRPLPVGSAAAARAGSYAERIVVDDVKVLEALMQAGAVYERATGRRLPQGTPPTGFLPLSPTGGPLSPAAG